MAGASPAIWPACHATTSDMVVTNGSGPRLVPHALHRRHTASSRRVVSAAAGRRGGGNGKSRDGGGAATQSMDSVEQREAARAEVSARISAARALAQRLAQEKAAAAAAAREATSSVDLEELEGQVQQATEQVVAAAAAADSAAAAAEGNGKPRRLSRRELKRMQAENQALQELVEQQAVGGAAAAERLSGLKVKYQQLSQKVANHSPLESPSSSRDGTAEPSGGSVDGGSAATAGVSGRAGSAAENGASPADPGDIAAVLEGLAADREQAASGAAPEAEAEAAAAAAGEPEPEQPNGSAALRSAAEAAMQRGDRVFAFPTNAVAAGRRNRLLYNRLWGPARHGRRLKVKAGFNNWQHIVEQAMSKEAALADLPNSSWWAADLEAPRQLFALEFVVADPDTGVVDNNQQRNFTLELEGATTEEAILAEHAAAFEAAETERLQALEEEEARLWEEQLQVAAREAEAARERAREQQAALVRAEAAKVAAERRGAPLQGFRLQDGLPGVFAWRPAPPAAGSTAVLAYNKAHGALRHARDVVAHWGYDGWWQEDLTHAPLTQMPREEVEAMALPDGDWWSARIEVPRTAAQLDFVLSDAAERAWDNNGQADFHSGVGGALHGAALEAHLAKLLRGPEEDEQQSVDRASKAAYDRVLAKARAQRRRRETQRTVLYTDPVTPGAGAPVTVFYNPDATVLRGRPEVWLRGCWNRWTHPECYLPRRMQPADPSGNLAFLKASVDVPADAQFMDMVFSNTGDLHGGFYDNNGGLDYHVPVSGGRGEPVRLRVAHVTVEMAPVAKVGGMGDVVTALGRAVQEEGHDVSVVLPKYDVLKYDLISDLRQTKEFWHAGVQVRVWQGIVEELHTTFLEPQNGIFWVGCVYGRNDDASRFAWFCGAAAEYLRTSDHKPDIVHCHDWPTAPVTWADLGGAKTLFTIHNLNYGADLIGRAMAAAAAGTTVSPTYATEVSGHPAVAPHFGKFYGIRNGIDQDIWDPEQDAFLPRNYGPADVAEGKAAAKAEIRRRFGLSDADLPMAAVVTRLTHQKGTHLIKHAAWRTLERGGQFVLLGSAPDPRVQGEFDGLAGQLHAQHGDRCRFHFEYDEPLSHLIYAGADILLVPSMFEPCGLTQMIAMRYGTVPVVRRTGGLADTVFDVDDDGERAADAGHIPNGFSFEGTDSNALDYALNRALTMWYTDKQEWADLTRRIMEQDWSWLIPSQQYVDLMFAALKR